MDETPSNRSSGYQPTLPAKPEKENAVSKTTDKPAKKKLSQAEWDAKFGSDEPAQVNVAKPSKASKVAKEAEPKKVAKKTPKAKEEAAEKVHGRIANTNAIKLKSAIGDCTKKSYLAIAETFGKGKTIEDALGDLEITYEPPRSDSFKKGPRKYLMGYIASMRSKKLLIEC